MPDDRNKTGSPDGDRIGVSLDHDLRCRTVARVAAGDGLHDVVQPTRTSGDAVRRPLGK